MHYLIKTVALLLLVFSKPALAHINSGTGTFLRANSHLLFINKSPLAYNEVWQIPGTLLGSEASPPDKGITLNEAQVAARWQSTDAYGVNAMLSSHHGDELSLENIFIDMKSQNEYWALALGRMDAAFSPYASWHAYNRDFNETPLIMDVIFDGHVIDEGLRASYQNNKHLVGIEFWHGSAWPASSGEYAADVFYHLTHSLRRTDIKSGIWLMYSEALQRSDKALSGGHRHDNISPSQIQQEFFFTGHNVLAGAFVDLSHPLTGNTRLRFHAELIQLDSTGELSESNRVAELEHSNTAYIAELALDMDDMSYALRHEQMSFDNILSGPAANLIAQDANLINNGFTPERTQFSISKTLKGLTYRAEATHDKSIDDDATHRFSLAVVWQDTVWKKP